MFFIELVCDCPKQEIERKIYWDELMVNHMENGGNISSENIRTLKFNETQSDQKIGGLLRQFRKKSGVTQTELAAVAGITPQQIQKYEKGADRIAVSRLMTLLDFLDINFEEFIRAMKNCNRR